MVARVDILRERPWLWGSAGLVLEVLAAELTPSPTPRGVTNGRQRVPRWWATLMTAIAVHANPARTAPEIPSNLDSTPMIGMPSPIQPFGDPPRTR